MVICAKQADRTRTDPLLFRTADSPGPGRTTTVEEIAMDTFDPRYQLEAEQPDIGRERSPLAHAEIQQTLFALDHLAWRLREQMRALQRP
jgi:hypothetical protein